MFVYIGAILCVVFALAALAYHRHRGARLRRKARTELSAHGAKSVLAQLEAEKEARYRRFEAAKGLGAEIQIRSPEMRELVREEKEADRYREAVIAEARASGDLD